MLAALPTSRAGVKYVWSNTNTGLIKVSNTNTNMYLIKVSNTNTPTNTVHQIQTQIQKRKYFLYKLLTILTLQLCPNWKHLSTTSYTCIIMTMYILILVIDLFLRSQCKNSIYCVTFWPKNKKIKKYRIQIFSMS